MKGDFSRDTFDPAKQFTRVLMQQGRVQLDADWNEQIAIWNRSHNDGNVLSIGERTVTQEDALHIVDTWLNTAFEGGRHQARIDKIDHA